VEREALSEWRGEMALYTQGDLTGAAREHLRWLLERSMETELGQRLGAERYVRSMARSDWRNGYRKRDLTTELGLLRGIRVPRSRQGGYAPSVFGRYSRRQPLVNAAIMEMFIAGVATRRVGEILEALLGDCPSASTVSRVTQELDERVRAFHHRALEDCWRFLMLDGVTMAVKGAGGLRKRLVLVAYVVDGKGRRQLLDFRLAQGESEAEWTAFLESLYRRGLEGQQLRLVVTDGGGGARAAAKAIYGDVPQQRCWVHKLRNVAGKVRRKDQPEVLQGARAIYLADTKRQARQAFRSWEKRWEPAYAEAVACLRKDLDALLCCFDYPKALRPKIRTTNPIERAFREVRRRTRPMSAFTNDRSCERIIYALIAHLNSQWSQTPSKPSPQSTHNT
jgi:transposase-like protein